MDLSIIANEIDLNCKDTILGLTSEEKQRACRGYANRKTLQKSEIMKEWKKKNRDRATYRTLAEHACKYQQPTVAKKVREIVLGGIDSESEVIRTFSDHLRECYTRESQHPSHYQWPEIRHQHYIKQVIYRQEQSGHSKDSESLGPPVQSGNSKNSKQPVKLDEILDEHQHNIVMIEGVAGSGKTTLLWYLCKQWAEGQLLDKFHLLIHISLNNLYIKDAKSLADIIPHPDETLQKAVAKEISGNRGELKVCFLLDSCDEAPISLRNGFLKKFLEMLPINCKVLLTSRPTATDYLTSCNIAHDKVYLQGCKSGVIFDTLLQNDPEKRKKINNLLELKPEMCALCDLPINAIILIFIHEMLNGDNVPITRTGLYTLMISNFLVRHMKAPSVQQYRGPIRDIERDLPPEIDRKLRKLCLLAYNAVSSNKNAMTYSELMKEGMEKPDESFGLLQIRESVTVYGPEFIYSFPHLSIQEFLAAIHIKRIGNEDEEASAIKRLDDKDPLSPVITFYAGLTKFKNKKVQDLLLHKLENARFETDKVLDHITCKSNDARRSLLSLLNCIYESQDKALVKLYVPPLTTEESLFHACGIRCLSFVYLALYPSDCLSIGYYVREVCQVIKGSTINLDLDDCHINEVGMEVLAKELKKGTLTFDNELSLDLANNLLNTHRGIKPIKTLLSGQSNITQLGLPGCIRPKSIQRTFLKCVVEGLDNSTLQTITIGHCGITFIHVHYLVLLLTTNNCLEGLNLSQSDLGKAIPLFSKVLRFSHRLLVLDLIDCNIDDHGLNCLTKAAVEHPSLRQLELCFNPLTSAGVRESLLIFQHNPNISLTMFGINKDLLNEDAYRIIYNINSSREKFHLPLFEIRTHLNDKDIYEFSKEYPTKKFNTYLKGLNRN